MINKHIVNIGYPRSGTTWLWENANFEPKLDKENAILTTSLDFDHYVKYYKQYQISANFQPNLWCVDREIIQFVQQHSTHITLIVRNPFDFVERYFDWIYRDQNIKTLTDYIVYNGFVNYRDVVDRWSSNATKFKVFFFDDLTSHPEKFFKQYMLFCEIPIANNEQINYTTKVNANPKRDRIKLDFTQEQVKFINNQIDQFQVVAGRDISHWKR